MSSTSATRASGRRTVAIVLVQRSGAKPDPHSRTPLARVQIALYKEVGRSMHLAAVAGSHDQEVGFCSYCGRLEDDGRRVCSNCGLGVRLHTDATVLRSPGSSFLVVRGDGIVSAASAAAERLLGDPVGRHVSAVLRSEELPAAVALAAVGRPSPAVLSAAGMKVTVASCGLPPAALVLLERV